MSTKKDIFWRAYLIYFGFVLALIVVLYKTFMIQIEGRTNVFEETEVKIPTRLVSRTPRMGEILDINYTPLLTSVSFYDIHMDPTVIEQKTFDEKVTDLSRGLAKIFPERSAREYENHIRLGRERKNRYLLIHKKVTNEQRKAIARLPIFEEGRLEGGLIDNEEIIIRKRPNGELLKRTLGYYQKNRQGELRVGLEGAYYDYLKGEDGQEIEQKISTGWKKTGQIVKDAVEGANIVTTIDKEIQEVAHSELERQLKNQGARSGSVVVMDVKTGYIKAISNLTRLENGSYQEIYNYAVGFKEVPGSTFKLASLMAALEDKRIKITDEVNADGKYTFYGKTYEDALDWGYGRITIKKAFEKSSNVFTKIIYNAYRKDPQTYIDRLKSYGLNQPLGLDIAGEPTPTMYEPGTKNWSGLSLPSMAIGYEVQQTPIQTLAFYNAVANKGRLVKPQFVKEIRRGQDVVKYFKPITLIEKICSDKTLSILKECLIGVMKEGTGKDLKSSLFDIAGKTGTARILNDDARYGEEGEWKYQASFVGFFPAKEPIYSCIVVVSAPSKDIYGATVSGTVFAAIANKVYASTLRYHKAINEKRKKIKEMPSVLDGNRFDLIQVFKQFKLPYSNSEIAPWVNVSAFQNNIVLTPKRIQKDRVPNLVGMNAKDAVYLAESAGLHVYIRGFGKVVKQSIPSGKEIFNGGVIEITLE